MTTSHDELQQDLVEFQMQVCRIFSIYVEIEHFSDILSVLFAGDLSELWNLSEASAVALDTWRQCSVVQVEESLERVPRDNDVLTRLEEGY